MEKLASRFVVLLLLPCMAVSVYRRMPKDLYSFTLADIDGKEMSLGRFRGKVLLIVNVASECGFTDNHYKELVELHNALKDEEFSILAFPCNQFGQQEPKKNSAVSMFVKEEYGVEFPMFSKIAVAGEIAHPLYIWLYRQSGHYPNWNFCKYLIDHRGRIQKYADSYTSPMKMLSDIRALLHGMPLDDSNVQRTIDEL